MSDPVWIDRRALLFLHESSLAAHGGSTGIRDEGLLDSALARPRNKWLYTPESDIASLSASYGFELAKNHAFVDGNKLAAFQATGLFLALNRIELEAKQLDAIRVVLGLASGEISEAEFAVWIREHSVTRP
jgi:death on curing protein